MMNRFDFGMTGIIKKFIEGLKIEFDEKGQYWLVDCWDNCQYIAKYNKQSKVFAMYDELEWCKTLTEGQKIVKNHFPHLKIKV